MFILPTPNFQSSSAVKDNDTSKQLSTNHWTRVSNQYQTSNHDVWKNQFNNRQQNGQQSCRQVSNSYNDCAQNRNHYAFKPQYQRNAWHTTRHRDDAHTNNIYNKQFSCERCNKWFANKHLYDIHCGQHIKCGLDGCKFEAMPKVIASHQKMQHFCFKDASIAKKFMSLDTPDEIAKWREERRKNFPTKASVLAKTVNEKKISSDDKSKSNNDRNNTRNFGAKKRNGGYRRFNKHYKRKNYNKTNNFGDERNSVNSFSETKNKTIDESVKPCNIDNGEPIIKRTKPNIVSDDLEDGEIIDSDDSESVSKSGANVVPKKIGSLGLLSMYASDSDSDKDNENTRIDLVDKNNVNSVPQNIESSEQQKKTSDIAATEQSINEQIIVNEKQTHEDCTDLVDDHNAVSGSSSGFEQRKVSSSKAKLKTKSNYKKGKRNIKKVIAPKPRPRKLTLFEKLLVSDVKRNESAIMECMQVIVDNNFLQKE